MTLTVKSISGPSSFPDAHQTNYFFSTHCGSRSSELISANNWWYARSVSLLMIIISNRWPHLASMSRAVAMISFSSSSYLSKERNWFRQKRTTCHGKWSLPYKARPLSFSSGATFLSSVERPARCMASGPIDAAASDSADGDSKRKSFHSQQRLVSPREMSLQKP